MLEANPRWYRGYAFFFHAYAWMPVFFLYLIEVTSLREALWLEAIYYAGVVALEVPSGYLSDRLGRCVTLRLASGALTVAYVMFVLAGGFWALAAAQLLLAAGIALNSGTDTSFHLDALEALGRADEYETREAVVSRWMFWSNAGACILGGVAATVLGLRAAYAVSGIAALGALYFALRFVEPTAAVARSERAFFAQVGECVSLARSPRLAWFVACAVLLVVVNHIPYEFYQPYLTLALADVDASGWANDSVPLIAGLHAAGALVIAGWVGGRSAGLSQRLGVRRLLLLSLVAEMGLIGLMALWLHPLVVVALVLRSAPRALQHAPLNAAIAPALPTSLRATFLSLQSLAGRLSYATLLLLLSMWGGGSTSAGWGGLSAMLRTTAIVVLVGLAGLALWARLSPRRVERDSG